MNAVNLSGYIKNDPETFEFERDGKKITGAKFTLVVYHRSKNKEKDEVSYFDCVSYNAGEAIKEHLHDGSRAWIEASAKQERWEKDGQKRSRVIFIASSVEFDIKGKQDIDTQQESDSDWS